MQETRTFRAFRAIALARLSWGQARSARGAALAVSASFASPFNNQRRRWDWRPTRRGQTGQPMYRRSVGRGKRYEAHLGPLLRALGDSAATPRP